MTPQFQGVKILKNKMFYNSLSIPVTEGNLLFILGADQLPWSTINITGQLIGMKCGPVMSHTYTAPICAIHAPASLQPYRAWHSNLKLHEICWVLQKAKLH